MDIWLFPICSCCAWNYHEHSPISTAWPVLYSPQLHGKRMFSCLRSHLVLEWLYRLIFPSLVFRYFSCFIFHQDLIVLVFLTMIAYRVRREYTSCWWTARCRFLHFTTCLSLSLSFLTSLAVFPQVNFNILLKISCIFFYSYLFVSSSSFFFFRLGLGFVFPVLPFWTED